MAPQKKQKSVSSFDPDCIAIVGTFKQLKEIPTYSEAMEKLIVRAKQLGLHRMTEEQFEAFLDRHLQPVAA